MNVITQHFPFESKSAYSLPTSGVILVTGEQKGNVFDAAQDALAAAILNIGRTDAGWPRLVNLSDMTDIGALSAISDQEHDDADERKCVFLCPVFRDVTARQSQFSESLIAANQTGNLVILPLEQSGVVNENLNLFSAAVTGHGEKIRFRTRNAGEELKNRARGAFWRGFLGWIGDPRAA